MRIKYMISAFFLGFYLLGVAQAPQGYYDDAEEKSGYELKTALSEITTNGHQAQSYSSLWVFFNENDTDKYYENDGTLLDIYSENPIDVDPYNYQVGSDQCGNYQQEGDCYNREHLIPQSWFGQGMPMRTDIHHIFPVDGYVNAQHGHMPFGEVDAPVYVSNNGSKKGQNSYDHPTAYSGEVFEPIDEFKGDIARAYLYMAMRYEDQVSSWQNSNSGSQNTFDGSSTQVFNDWTIEMLIKWHEEDPVSERETDRNNAAYTFQGNRNPFIDHPEFVGEIWGNTSDDEEPPTVPTNLSVENITHHSVALSWIASTDNEGVAGYKIYVDGTEKTTTTSTNTTVSNLAPATHYTVSVSAYDYAGNESETSGEESFTTLEAPEISGGMEDFESMVSSEDIQDSQYGERIWTNPETEITWKATDARIDQEINGKALTLRDGNLVSTSISGGLHQLTATTKQAFGNTPGKLEVYANDEKVGEFPYGEKDEINTVSIDDINIEGSFVLEIRNPNTDNARVAIDDLIWEGYSTSGTENTETSAFLIYPNPLQGNELFLKGTDLSSINNISIFDITGVLVQQIKGPFYKNQGIQISTLAKGIYFVNIQNKLHKLIVE